MATLFFISMDDKNISPTLRQTQNYLGYDIKLKHKIEEELIMYKTQRVHCLLGKLFK